MSGLALLALAWVAWCALHSLLINTSIQTLARRALGRFGRSYRLLYILVSVLTLAPVLWYQEALPQRLLLEASLPLTLVRAALLLYGALMFALGARAYDLREFLGIRQWRQAGERRGPTRLRTDGVLAHVRHPWYSGGIAFIWGFGAISDVFLLSRTLLTLYLIAGTFLEEQRLLAELGDRYRAYRRAVPMLVPALRPRRFAGQTTPPEP